MIRYMKRIAQVVVLTAVLVFSGLLVVNSSFVTKEAEAGNHITSAYHHHKVYNDGTVCYYMLTGYFF